MLLCVSVLPEDDYYYWPKQDGELIRMLTNKRCNYLEVNIFLHIPVARKIYLQYQVSGSISCLRQVLDRIPSLHAHTDNTHLVNCVVIQLASCPFHLADIQSRQ
jgi:hypothetical protein